MRKRIEGYREAIREADLREYFLAVEPEAIDKQVEKWLAMKAPPAAIFCLNELLGLMVIESLAARHVRRPDRMAFIGFDKIQLAAIFDPPRSAIVQPAAMIGEQAALRLVERIDCAAPLPWQARDA